MPIHYKDVAMDDLRAYGQQKQALQNIRERIAALQAQAEGVRSQLSDETPVQGGGNRIEERIINNIVERDRLKLNYQITKRNVERTERGLSILSEREREILISFAGADRRDKRVADRLAESFGISRHMVCAICDEALYRFTLCCYGVTEL